MKILVLGATGMAGHTISLFLKEVGHELTAFSRSNFEHCKNITGDVTDFSFLGRVINEGNYDAVINAIGILNENAEEYKAMAVLLNSYLPHYLHELTHDMATRIIHISTDCVFSGKTGSYTEKSLRDGESFYDRSKALGELDNNKDLTFRTSIIGPDMKKSGIGLFNWFMKQEGKINGFSRVFWTGITAPVLAQAIEYALREDLSGLYNLVNNDRISKYSLLKLFNRYFRDGKVMIVECDKKTVDKSLVNTRNDFAYNVPGYEAMIEEMKVWIDKHSELYPHYFA